MKWSDTFCQGLYIPGGRMWDRTFKHFSDKMSLAWFYNSKNNNHRFFSQMCLFKITIHCWKKKNKLPIFQRIFYSIESYVVIFTSRSRTENTLITVFFTVIVAVILELKNHIAKFNLIRIINWLKKLLSSMFQTSFK